ncbi:MAG: EamA family transporter [Clostridia bacterium]|nr:EamA family transporter [Clostridia bacterium]
MIVVAFSVFLLFTVLRGFHAVVTKMIQKDYVDGFSASIFLTVVYSLAQALFLPLMPPYYSYSYEPKMLVNPFFFAVFFMVGYILVINALGKGPISLTNIINSFMQLVPIIAGIFLWNDTIGPFQWVGIGLFVVILFLFNESSYEEDNKSKGITSGWILMAVGSALFGGISVIFTKQHMILYSDAIKEYLILFNLMVVVMGLPYVLWAVYKKKLKIKLDKRYLTFIIITALIQDINNIIFMYYINRLNGAFFFPLIGILSIVSVVIMSRLLLKEVISKKAYVGILISLVSIYLLGI